MMLEIRETLSKVVWERSVLDSLILKLLTRVMKEIQFSMLCAKAQKLPFDVGPNANDTFQRIIQGCVTKRSLQYFSHFQGHVGLSTFSFFPLFFLVLGTHRLLLFERKTGQPGTQALKLGTLLLLIKYHLFWTNLISYQVHARFIR